MKTHSKVKFIVIAIIMFFVATGFCVLNSTVSQATIIPSESGAENDNQRIVQEVAKAYYLKGDNIQYEGARRNQYGAPEEVTSQSASYLVCSGFTYATYYNAFNLVTPEVTIKINAYGRDFYQKLGHEDVVLYEGAEHQNKITSETYHDDILNLLQVGDIISYYRGDGGHATLVYDFKYDNNGRKTEAIILHSTSNFIKTTNKLSHGLSWNDAAPNSITGVDEGTVQYSDLTHLINWTKSASNFTIYRPLAQASAGVYNRVSCTGTGSNIDNITCSSERSPLTQKESSLARLAYPGIQIEKTVDAFNGSVVEPGDTLTYTISITNNSNAEYKNIPITENIPTDLVSSNTGASQLKWTISSIPAGATYHQSYSVKVKNDTTLKGREIISTGNVANIPSATVTNTIGRNLTSEEKSKIVTSYNSLRTTHTGIDLINQIYVSALEQDLGLTHLKLAAHHNTDSNSDSVKERNRVCNPYFETTSSGALLNSVWGSTAGRNEILNQEHILAKNVLNHYYSVVNVSYQDTTTCLTKVEGVVTAAPKNWGLSNTGSPDTANRSDRAMRVYPETLQTGDILLYANTGSTMEGKDPVTKENGTYAFIWIENSDGVSGNFYGVNSLVDGTPLNQISGVNNKSANNLQTLFGKDYYVILRPSLTMTESVNPEPEPIPEPTPEPEPVPVPDIPEEGDQSSNDKNTGIIEIPNTGAKESVQESNPMSNIASAAIVVAVIVIIRITAPIFRRKILGHSVQFGRKQ